MMTNLSAENVIAVLLQNGGWMPVDRNSLHFVPGLLRRQMGDGYVWTGQGKQYACSKAAIIAVEYSE